jgi:TetR/AcrR family transcriptional regulator, cholesterol catabolism regulator
MPRTTRTRTRSSEVPASGPDSRFDRRLAGILEHATGVFYEKGYEGASMRDLSRASGMSLAGLYYYFESKERLLYLIQKHTFETILAELKLRLANTEEPVQQIRVFVANHLEYFLANQKAMTVLSHEDEVLSGTCGEEVRQIKHQYYQICRDIMDRLKLEHGLDLNTRIAVLGLFGMMNWIYTWYRPRVDGDAAELARQMSTMFLSGVLSRAGANVGENGAPPKTAARTRKTASSTI